MRGSILIIIAATAVVLVIAGIAGLVIFLRKKQKRMIEETEVEKEEMVLKGDLTDEEVKLREQMEEIKKLTGVSLTVADAREHDKEHKEMGYEDLYGKSAPEKMDEDTASVEETKEFIGEQIKKLEDMKIEDDNPGESGESSR